MVGVGGEAPMERIHGLVGLGYVFENLEKSQLMMLNFPCYIWAKCCKMAVVQSTCPMTPAEANKPE